MTQSKHDNEVFQFKLLMKLLFIKTYARCFLKKMIKDIGTQENEENKDRKKCVYVVHGFFVYIYYDSKRIWPINFRDF